MAGPVQCCVLGTVVSKKLTVPALKELLVWQGEKHQHRIIQLKA
jgi:hypothetical protein